MTAKKDGKFDSEIVPVPIKTRKGIKEFTTDEHPRPDVTIEQLAKLPNVFKKDGTVSAGNASVSIFLNIIYQWFSTWVNFLSFFELIKLQFFIIFHQNF